jgi:prefoldin subunit 5
MIWALIAMACAIGYVALSHDKHINRLYSQLADLEQERTQLQMRLADLEQEIVELQRRR